MLLLEAAPDADAILPFVDDSVCAIREAGGEPRFIVTGPEAYATLREAVAARYNRENQHVEQVQWLTVVVDPARGDRICVLPTPREASDGARLDSL
ncbi:MAG: family 4C encapsulin nanocompartment shell protein [Bacteroidota bacterium]